MPKTTIRVRKKRWEYFNHECKVMSLRRDDLLNRLIPEEIAIAANIPTCDAIGSRWLKDRWVTMWSSGDFELMTAPVLLSDEVLASLNDVCANKGIPRDAFIDCFLEFLTSRLIDPALVIKNPRTEQDIGSQVAEIMTDDDISNHEARAFLFDIASDWIKGRNPASWNKSLYEIRLSYNAEKVETERSMLEVFAANQ